MRPRFTSFDFMNGVLRHFIGFGQPCLCHADVKAPSYFSYLFLCKFGSAVIDSLSAVKSAAPRTVAHIVQLCSDVKMFWIETLSVIAFMQHKFFGINIKTQVEPCTNTMHKPKFFINSNAAITMPRDAASPDPTAGRINFLASIKTVFNHGQSISTLKYKSIEV